MASESESSAAAESAAGPALTSATRHRLQQMFEHGKRSGEKKEYDYANQFYAQCVCGDPANLVYLQEFLSNLSKKYNNNKKGAKLAGLKGSSARKAIKAASGKKEWRAVIAAGCEMLKINPWDVPTLVAMSKACTELKTEECQLYYLRWALNAHPKDPEVNKTAAEALSRMGQFDQAIICWHRVEEAKPGDPAASKAISQLTVEKTIQQGGFKREFVESLGVSSSGSSPSLPATGSSPNAAADGEADPPPPQKPYEEQLREAIEADPAEISNYLDLSDHLIAKARFDDADQLLQQAHAAAGGGDLAVRQRIEDLQLARGRHQLSVAKKRRAADDSEANRELVQRIKAGINQAELEIYAARSDRDPKSSVLKYELAIRLKRAGKYPEAIQAFQATRDDSKRKAEAHLELGECFQHIEQYKLALTNYETAIAEAGNQQSDIRKLALYRAGVLATGMRDLDRAEQHLTELAGIDFGYRDVASRLDKVSKLRDSG